MTPDEIFDAVRAKCQEFISQSLGVDDDLLLGARLAAAQILEIVNAPETPEAE